VVNLIASRFPRAQRTQLTWSRAGVLFAGIASLPTQSGSISLLPPNEQLRAIEGMQTEPLWRKIELMPNGNFLPPAGGLAPALTSGFSWTMVGLAEAQGSDPPITASLNSAVSNPADLFGVAESAGGLSTIAAIPTLRAAPTMCEQLPQQLQAFTQYWNNHSISGPPVRFAEDPPTDPVRGPSGDPANLSWPGAPGAWCPPAALPFAPDSSPLANRAFWTPIAFLLSGLLVFWLSRGFKMPY
jgi:hypothetical protein